MAVRLATVWLGSAATVSVIFWLFVGFWAGVPLAIFASALALIRLLVYVFIIIATRRAFQNAVKVA